MRDFERIRAMAEIDDPTWEPGRAPEDEGHRLEFVPHEWPRWVTSWQEGRIGSLWRASADMRIVAPDSGYYPTLSILAAAPSWPDRYWLPIGATLELIAASNPEVDAPHIDPIDFYRHIEGWAAKEYRVLAGSSAGARVWMSCALAGGRFPPSSLQAHAALEPAWWTERPVPELADPLFLFE